MVHSNDVLNTYPVYAHGLGNDSVWCSDDPAVVNVAAVVVHVCVGGLKLSGGGCVHCNCWGAL